MFDVRDLGQRARAAALREDTLMKLTETTEGRSLARELADTRQLAREFYVALIASGRFEHEPGNPAGEFFVGERSLANIAWDAAIDFEIDWESRGETSARDVLPTPRRAG